MKLPEDVLIPREELTAYLLVSRAKNDKSGFLAQAGFTQQNPDMLEAAIIRFIRDNDAVQNRKDEYGTYYRVTGTLQGPNGDLNVITVWIYGAKESKYRFITLKPDKE
ncbi:MAG: hypothetical protein DWB42_05870 [Chloroflexi bacterium]|nr:hypothetical protein [Chloroflexota bacterium]MDL1883099.1 hypothetical protein [Anaerolineae bacterium CFX8]